MKPVKTVLLLLVIAALVIGCGQKGPLYQEAATENSDAAAQAPEGDQDQDAGERQ